MCRNCAQLFLNTASCSFYGARHIPKTETLPAQVSHPHSMFQEGVAFQMGGVFFLEGGVRFARRLCVAHACSFPIATGWYRDLQSLPLFTGASRSEIMPTEAPDGDGPSIVALDVGVASTTAAPEGRSVEQSNRQVDYLRRKCKHTMHVSAKIMSSSITRNLTAMITEVSLPLRERFGVMLTTMHTRSGTLEYYRTMAAGDWEEELWLCSAALRASPEVLEEIRFETLDNGNQSSMQGQRLADFTVRFVLSLMRERFCTLSAFRYSLPLRYAALLHYDERVVRGVLQELSEWWELLATLEEMATTRQYFKGLLKGIAWPDLPWVRMIFIKLAESEFTVVTPAVRTRLEACFKSLGTSVAAEMAFKILRGAEGSYSSRSQSRVQRWFRTSVSRILPEMDCPAVGGGCQPVEAKRIPPTLFEPESVPCSLSPESMATLIDSHNCHSPQVCQLQPFGWLAALQHQDRPADLLTAWLSQLAIVGTYIRCGDWTGIVIEATSRGVLL